jgi:N-acetylneuraminate lyase
MYRDRENFLPFNTLWHGRTGQPGNAGKIREFSPGIGITYNLAPAHFVKIYYLYIEGEIEEASRIQDEINRVIYLMNSYENRSFQKAIMRYIGFDCGFFRMPYAPLTEDEYQEFAAELDGLNILTRAEKTGVEG